MDKLGYKSRIPAVEGLASILIELELQDKSKYRSKPQAKQAALFSFTNHRTTCYEYYEEVNRW